MRHLIITGASKGFGQAIALAWADQFPDTTYHLIARSDSEQTKEQLLARQPDATVFCYRQDLSETINLKGLTDQLASHIHATSDQIVLINNAGTLQPIGPAGKYEASAYHQNLELNYVAPLMLSHWFLESYQSWQTDKRIVCISSGAAQHPYYGWSHYCSTKAGVDMFVRTVALEQSKAEYPVDILGFNPSRIETNMQEQIRSQEQDDFAEVEDFKESAQDGRNNPPEKLANALVTVIRDRAYENGEIVRGKDFI
jgi:benzil reductase ((S)-benzoin forming)